MDWFCALDAKLGEDGQDGGPARPGMALGRARIQAERPWVAVWLVLLDRAMDQGKVPRKSRGPWLGALRTFLEEQESHPSRISAADIRGFLFRSGELGGASPERSLSTAMEALAFFYARVVPRPALSEAARQPFSGPLPALPAPQAEPSGSTGGWDWRPA